MLRANASTDKFITKNKQFNEKCLLTTIIFFICGLLMKVILRSKYLLLCSVGAIVTLGVGHFVMLGHLSR